MTAAESVVMAPIIGTTVLGLEAFHATCDHCQGWRCHRQPHDAVETATRCAERHLDKVHP